jgi:D-cysteine desulfhydrase
MCLSNFPRRGYVTSPTPIEFLPRFSRALNLGVDVFIKRDDLLPGTLGGNKTRKLDFSIAEALSLGADALVTCGAVQSNHCRLTLAWAVREGLDCHLILEERVKGTFDSKSSGNNFIFKLLGVKSVTVVPGGADVEKRMREKGEELKLMGKRPYLIPGGAADPLGALGYVSCAFETANQLQKEFPDIKRLVCASGSGGTQAGLLAGFSLLEYPMEVTGINVRRFTKEDQEKIISKLTYDTLDLLGKSAIYKKEKVLCEPRFLGKGYSLPDAKTMEAIRLLAKTEAILADPVYVGKALAGLIGLMREGFFKRGEKVLFLHTGGFPALFSYLESFTEDYELKDERAEA